MNAVINKPRAKVAPAPAKPATIIPELKTTIADIRTWIVSADQKLEMAYDAAEKGEPVDVLLDHICHSVMLEPMRIIRREDLTQADTQRVYDRLFPALACIQGAIKLADSSVVRHTLEEAFGLLDTAQTALDPVNEAVRSLAEGGPERDFTRGRDLAVSMLAEADEVQATNPDRAYFKRAYRNGKAQHRFTYQYVELLLDDPALLEGFNAVLSAKLADQCQSLASHYAASTAEYQSGVVGADGTQPLDDDAPSLESPAAGLVTIQAAEAGPPTPDEWGDFDPYCLMLQALAVTETAANDDGSDSLWGVHSLIEKSVVKVNEVIEEKNAGIEDACNRASNELAGALGVLHAVNNDGLDNSLLYAVDSLLRMAKSQIDGKIERLIQARLERGAA